MGELVELLRMWPEVGTDEMGVGSSSGEPDDPEEREAERVRAWRNGEMGIAMGFEGVEGGEDFG
jgi:hypothetical protein